MRFASGAARIVAFCSTLLLATALKNGGIQIQTDPLFLNSCPHGRLYLRYNVFAQPSASTPERLTAALLPPCSNLSQSNGAAAPRKFANWLFGSIRAVFRGLISSVMKASVWPLSARISSASQLRPHGQVALVLPHFSNSNPARSDPWQAPSTPCIASASTAVSPWRSPRVSPARRWRSSFRFSPRPASNDPPRPRHPRFRGA